MLDSPLQLGFFLGGVGLAVELMAAFTGMRLIRSLGYAGALFLTTFSVTVIVVADLNIATFLVASVAGYRIINDFRALSGRQHSHRTMIVTKRTSFTLLFFQLVSLGIWFIHDYFLLTPSQWLTRLLIVSLIVSFILIFVTKRNLAKTNVRPSDKYTTDMELPTVSICIPARNETEDLPLCLESILQTEYPKLEVLVLDDCSQDKTSEVIKSFAQRGVRFIKGEEPKNGWLAKNQAYQQLADAASGEILLFCGVDVRIDWHDVRTLVGTLIARRKQMISVLPKGKQTREHAGLIQPMRYWWELALPRRLFNRPPVLSTCWLIRKDALVALGGFEAVNNTVIPEGYFARELATADGYSFMRSSTKLSVSTTKKLDQQWEMAVRVRYPQLRKRPEMVMLISLAELWIFLLPISIFVAGFFSPSGVIWLLGGLTTFSLVATHYLIIKAWEVNNNTLPIVTLPIAVALDIVLMNYSMWRFEFDTVTWKERNICIPVMQTFKHLPRV